MSAKINIDGKNYEVPDEDDWELGEVAEFSRLRDQYGDIGSTIGIVWLVKHREDPSFTVEQAHHIKVGQFEEVEAGEDPTPSQEPSTNGGPGTTDKPSLPSETHVVSGTQ